MITIIDSSRKGSAVYWAPTVGAFGRIIPDKSGRETFAQPVELTPEQPTGGVFWMATVAAYLDSNGEQRTSKAIVFVGIDLAIGGMLMSGDFNSIPTGMTNTPQKIQGIARIHRFDKIPTLSYDQFVRKAYL